MNTVSVLKEQLEGAHAVLEQTMADVSEEQANWAPPGIANPLGATYAHAVSAEDAMVNGMLRGGATLIASASAGKVGLSELPPTEGDYGEGAGRVKVALPSLKGLTLVGAIVAVFLVRYRSKKTRVHWKILTGWGLGK